MIKKVFGSQLRLNMASGTVVTIANIIIMLVSYPVYLHYLGYERYGVWLILATVLGFIQMGGNLGIEPAVTKLVAEEYGRENTQGIESYVLMALVTLSTSGIIGFILIVCSKSQSISLFNLTGDNATAASHLLPYIGLLCIYAFITRSLGATLSGLGRMDLTNYIQLTGRIVLLCVTVSLLYVGLGIESLLIGNIASYIVIHIISIVLIRRMLHVRLLRASNWDWQRLKRLFQFGGTIFGSSLLGLLIGPFNKVMLSRYAGVATIPVYELAFRGAVMFRSLFESGFRAMMPEISRLSGVGTVRAWDRLRAVNRRAIRLILLGGLPLYGALFIVAEILLRLWLRDRYIAVIPAAFRIMLIGSYFSLLCVPAFHTLMGLGKVHYCLLASVIIAATNFTSVILILLLTRSISVNSIGGGLMIAFGLSSLYVIYKTCHLLSVEDMKDN